MKSAARLVVGAVSIAMLGCATRPENVTAHYVSTGRYDTYDCKRLVREAEEVDARARQLTGTLDSKATTDAVLVGVGMILFWPALLALPATGGKAEEQELGRLKGESQAIQRAYKEKECDVKAAPQPTRTANAESPSAEPISQPAVATPSSLPNRQ